MASGKEGVSQTTKEKKNNKKEGLSTDGRKKRKKGYSREGQEERTEQKKKHNEQWDSITKFRKQKDTRAFGSKQTSGRSLFKQKKK